MIDVNQIKCFEFVTITENPRIVLQNSSKILAVLFNSYKANKNVSQKTINNVIIKKNLDKRLRYIGKNNILTVTSIRDTRIIIISRFRRYPLRANETRKSYES